MRAMFLLCGTFDRTLCPSNENFCIYYKLEHHSSLEKYVYLLPENKIIFASQRIPGIDLKGNLTGDSVGIFRKVYLEDIRISMAFSELATFEEELCQSVLTDSIIHANRSRSTTPGSLVVTERRLKIFYHNRFKVVDPIPVVYLDLCSNSTVARNKSRPRRSLKNSRPPVNLDIKNVSSEEFCLSARNPAQLSVPVDPEVAIVFILEYVLGEATSARRDSNSDLVRQVSTAFTVRWGCYNLFANPEILDKEECVVKIRVPLQGTPDKFVTTGETEVNNHQSPVYTFDSYEKQLCCTLCPDGTLSFRDETKSALKFILSGTVSIGRRPQISQDEILTNATQSMVQSEPSISMDQTFPVCQEARRLSEATTPLKRSSLKPEVDPSERLQTYFTPSLEAVSMPVDSSQVATQFAFYNQWLQRTMRAQPCMAPPLAGTMMGPFVGGLSGPVFYEPIQPVPAACYALADQSSGVPLSIATRVQCGTGLSRAAYARLYSAGRLLPEATYYQIRVFIIRNNLQISVFPGVPEIKADNGEPAEIVTPQEDVDPVKIFNYKKEATDGLCVNEIVLQFLAYSTVEALSKNVPVPEEIYFTLQFYRFPQITTEKVRLGKVLDDYPDMEGLHCRMLERTANVENETVSQTPGRLPCYQVVFTLDPNFLRPGEYEQFFNYLLHNNLHLDVWDARSHLLLGTTAVELKYLCRQGRAAVQVTYSLDVMRDLQSTDSFELQSSVSLQGRLHLRMANVGRRSGKSTAGMVVFGQKPRQYLISNEGNAAYKGFRGGALSDACLCDSNTTKQVTSNDFTGCVVRARPLIAVSQELREMLKSETVQADKSATVRSSVDKDRQQKLARLRLVLQAMEGAAHTTDLIGHTTLSGVQKKREQIERMLANVAMVVHDLDVSFGCTEFFEFELKNPDSNEDTVHICVEDERNSTFVVTDPREVRVLKTAFGINTPTEDGLFATDVTGHASAIAPAGQGYLSIFLKPNETVRVPFKYMESSTLPTGAIGKNVQYTVRFVFTTSSFSFITIEKVSSCIGLCFSLGSIRGTNRSFSQLLLKVHNYPAVVDQTFRFIQPELSFLRKLVRLPPVNMNLQTGMPSFVQDGTSFANGSSVQLWTRVSDPSVLIESGKASFGESVDLLVKVGLGASPQVKEFLIAVYMEPFQLRAAYIWRWVIHALHRVDASATVGQLSAPIGLLLRTDGLLPEGGPRMISIYTSHPDELMLGTELTGQSKQNQGNVGLQFMVSPKAVYELKARIMPRQVGMRNYQINVVEATSQRVIRAWIICAEIKPPEVSKTYNIELPLLFRQNTAELCHKRVAYTNPYSHAKRLRIQTDRPDLLQFKDSEIEVPAGGTAQLALRFIPQPHPSVQRLYVFMKNEDENIEETFAIVAQYT
ncbi:hypothetical protein P879_05150 [Paragonimus westermani]|uniref:Nephrocystin-4 n=1 Tax=Paragonimus westermani TaxID=34504 RepID=A0A8T0DBU6_9TREM|nr:hypothetical protein P879_05150 [Paragonimus westermani]